MEMKRTAHACLDEGWGEGSTKPSPQQPCGEGRNATDLLHAKLGAPQGAAQLNEGLAQPNCRIVRLLFDVSAEPEITAPSRPSTGDLAPISSEF